MRSLKFPLCIRHVYILMCIYIQRGVRRERKCMRSYFLQVGELRSDSPAIHADVANFHFDNYQRFIHIHGCTYRYICMSRLTFYILSWNLTSSLCNSSYRICLRNGLPHKLEKQYSIDFKQFLPTHTDPQTVYLSFISYIGP